MERRKNLWQDDIEEIGDTQSPREGNICLFVPLLVICGPWIEDNLAMVSVSELGDSSTHEAVVIKRKRAIRHGLVPE